MIGTRGRQLIDDLFELERGFWLGGEDYFLGSLDEKCLLVFPQAGEMHGVRAREEIAQTATAPNRWSDLKVSHRDLIRPAPDMAIISYRADVTRADGITYSAFIGSAYVRRSSAWLLASHQHSPIAAD